MSLISVFLRTYISPTPRFRHIFKRQNHNVVSSSHQWPKIDLGSLQLFQLVTGRMSVAEYSLCNYLNHAESRYCTNPNTHTVNRLPVLVTADYMILSYAITF